jgi:hypothetical protein
MCWRLISGGRASKPRMAALDGLAWAREHSLRLVFGVDQVLDL